MRYIKAGGKQLNDSYGWYLTLKQVAEAGVFNLTGLTPMRSAEVADLYEVFTYLSACKAESDVQQEMAKQK